MDGIILWLSVFLGVCFFIILWCFSMYHQHKWYLRGQIESGKFSQSKDTVRFWVSVVGQPCTTGIFTGHFIFNWHLKANNG